MKFAHEFGELLATPIMLEAVMRVRASRGLLLPNINRSAKVNSYQYDRTAHGLIPWKLLCSFY